MLLSWLCKLTGLLLRVSFVAATMLRKLFRYGVKSQKRIFMKTQLKLLTSSLLLLSISVTASSMSDAPTQPVTHQTQVSDCETEGCVDQLLKLKRYAQNGNALAATLVAMAYSDGVGFEKNPTVALKMLKLGAAKNEPIALYNLSNWYRHGTNTEVDLAKADLYLDRAIRLSFPPAMVTKAALLAKNKDTASEQQAIALITKAAGLGHKEAQYVMAALLQGEDSSAEHLLTAAEYLRRLTLQSYKDSAEQLKVVIDRLSQTQQATAEDLAYLNETFDIEVIRVGNNSDFVGKLSSLNEWMSKTEFGRYNGKSTGSRIRGKLCGEGSVRCLTIRPNQMGWGSLTGMFSQ
jgi:hypothetical protein